MISSERSFCKEHFSSKRGRAGKSKKRGGGPETEAVYRVFGHNLLTSNKEPTSPGQVSAPNSACGLQMCSAETMLLLSFFSSAANVRSQKKGAFRRGVFGNMYASLGCGALSTKCTAGRLVLDYFLFPWA